MASRNVGPLRVRSPDQMLQTGFVVEGHLHNFDHVTILLAGRWRIDRRRGDYHLGQLELEGGYPTSMVLIEKDVWHRFEVLRGPACYMCVFPHRTESGDISEAYTGFEDAYGVPAADRVNRNPHIANK